MNNYSFRNVLVLGAGTIGGQVGLQCALYGIHATLFDVAADRLEAARTRQAIALADWVRSGVIKAEDAAAVQQRIRLSTDPACARDAELVSESVPEQLKLKREVLSQFGGLCPPETIITTNSSYFPPSMLATFSGRPDRFAALHFHSPVWYANVVDIMPQRLTSPATIERLAAFARQIGQTPIVASKEHPGYVYNTMLWQFLMAAMQLAGADVASVEDIDRAWMGVMKTPVGPFGILDLIGLDTVQNIIQAWPVALKDERVKQFVVRLHALVEAGHLGEKSGQGLYRHPGPSYREPGFLTPTLTERAQMQHGEAAAASLPLAPDLSPARGEEVWQTGSAAEAAEAVNGPAETTEAESRVVERFTLHMVPRPIDLRLEHRPTFAGAAWILGENAVARALAARLSASGVTVRQVPQAAGADRVAQWIANRWQAEPAAHLFLAGAWDDEGPATRTEPTAPEPAAPEAAAQARDPYTANFERRLLLPYVACQQWFALAAMSPLLDQATLVAATDLGGDFGISGNVTRAEGGALAGLLKAAFMEGAALNRRGPQVKVVDFASGTPPDSVAESLCREMALAQAAVLTGDRAEVQRRYCEIEVGYAGGQRRLVRLRPAPAQGVAAGLPRGGTWVVTGGARGITAYIAGELARRCGVTLHLIGSSRLAEVDYRQWTQKQIDAHRADVMRSAVARREKPNVAWDRVARQIEIQQNLARLAETGVRATYHACDLADHEALVQVLDRVRQTDGPIAGVIHGAGVERTGSFMRKTRDIVRSTLVPKYQGTLALMELTRSDPLRWFVVFGSLSGRFGGVGQTDYAMANDLAAKLVDRMRSERPECRSVLIHWPGWKDIGMAARSDSHWSLEHNAGHQLMSPQEGWTHLSEELTASDRSSEVVLINPRELPAELLEGPQASI